jgi:hypothetical protein
VAIISNKRPTWIMENYLDPPLILEHFTEQRSFS